MTAMADYIERSVAKDELLSWAVCIKHPEHLLKEDAMCVLDNIPAADVAPVVHGRWVGVHEGWGCCSNCHRMDGIDKLATHCRYCGANMDGDA